MAFGQIAVGGKARVAIRFADGSFQDGSYQVKDDGTLALSLYPKLAGDQAWSETCRREWDCATTSETRAGSV